MRTLLFLTALASCLLLLLQVQVASAQQCDLIVPANPLSAAGLATPYILKPPCDQTNPDLSVFVEAVILNTKTGNLGVYAPLVINQGTTPLITPVSVSLGSHDIVGIWFGANDNVRLVDNGHGSLAQGNCITGLSQTDPFGQVGACNAVQWFSAANTAISKRLLHVPPLKLGANGRPCYTTRGFEVVDQDQSDNVDVSYLAVGNRTAQSSRANLQKLGKQFGQAQVATLSNPSDNGLLDKFLFPALNCTPFSAPDLVDPGLMRPAQALNELQAARFQRFPIALVPAGDPMVLTNGQPNLKKVNAYRSIVNQPLANSLRDASTTQYCYFMLTVGLVSIIRDQPLTAAFRSPAAGSDNLFQFLITRFIGAFGPDNLNCTALLQMPVPVAVRPSVTSAGQHDVIMINDTFMDMEVNDTTLAGEFSGSLSTLHVASFGVVELWMMAAALLAVALYLH